MNYIFPFIYFVCVHLCIVHMCVCSGAGVKVTGQLPEFISFLLPYRFWELNKACQIW